MNVLDLDNVTCFYEFSSLALKKFKYNFLPTYKLIYN